jgi:hypothetical protein
MTIRLVSNSSSVQVPNLVTKAKEEARKLFVVTVFFAIGFSILILHTRLLTAGSEIQPAPFFRAIIGGLIVAKVLLTVDLLPFVHAFPEKPLVHNIAWKSLLYTAASVVVLYIDPFLKGLIRGKGFYAAQSQAWHELTMPRTWSVLIWLAVLLVVFVTMQELSHVIGKDQMKRMFLGDRKKRAVSEPRFRGAA